MVWRAGSWRRRRSGPDPGAHALGGAGCDRQRQLAGDVFWAVVADVNGGSGRWRSSCFGGCVCLLGEAPRGSSKLLGPDGAIAGENHVGLGYGRRWRRHWRCPLVEGIVCWNCRHLGQTAPEEALNLGFPNRTMTGSSGRSSLLWHHILELMVAGEEKWRCSVASTTAKTTGLSGVAQRSLSEGRE